MAKGGLQLGLPASNLEHYVGFPTVYLKLVAMMPMEERAEHETLLSMCYILHTEVLISS